MSRSICTFVEAALLAGVLLGAPGCVPAASPGGVSRLALPGPADGRALAIPRAESGLVRLHIEPEMPGISLDGAKVCAAPCDQDIDARGRARFFFRGPNMAESERFDLTGHLGDVTARVHPVSPVVRPVGFVLVGLGVYGLASALESIVVGAVLSGFVHAPRDAEPWFVSGAVAGGVGAGLTGLGAWLAARGRTTFEIVPAAPPSR